MRRAVLLAAFLATVAAAYLAPTGEVVGVKDGKPRTLPTAGADPSKAGRSAGDADGTVLEIQPRDNGLTFTSELFAALATPASAPIERPVVRAPIPSVEPPQAPTVPFRVLGSFVEDGQTGIFIEHEERDLIARIGDTVAGLYRIEALGEETLTVTYLPLDRQQVINIGPAASR